jgi:hypothetical protein
MYTHKCHHHCDGNHTDKRYWDYGSYDSPALPAPHCYGGKHYGSGVVDHINHTLAGRSAHLGLSLVRLWSLGHCWGAIDYHHRAASYWPNMKGIVQRARHGVEHGTHCAGQGGHAARLERR